MDRLPLSSPARTAPEGPPLDELTGFRAGYYSTGVMIRRAGSPEGSFAFVYTSESPTLLRVSPEAPGRMSTPISAFSLAPDGSTFETVVATP